MANIGLLQRVKIWEIIHITVPFTIHPNSLIREGNEIETLLVKIN